MLRLYNPESRQRSIYLVDLDKGTLDLRIDSDNQAVRVLSLCQCGFFAWACDE
jgi:hypothetical protein